METETHHPAALSAHQLLKRIVRGDRAALGRGITLVESMAPRHLSTARDLMSLVTPLAGNAVRLGVTGVPGVGKSTFVEALGGYLLERGKSVAVLAVDPSSNLTGGAILGDKTRMERLARDERCFIRPSATRGTLGGVARGTMEAMLVCEAAGFNVVIVETVGVGQNEVAVREMVDHFLLLMLPGAGDGLQGIKRGILELADQIAVNKCDGANQVAAQTAQGEYAQSMRFMTAATDGWRVPVETVSSLSGEGICEVWENVERFMGHTRDTGVLMRRRKRQLAAWFRAHLEHQMRTRFFETRRDDIARAEDAFVTGTLDLSTALSAVLDR